MSNRTKDTTAYKTITEIAANCIFRLKIDPKNEEWVLQSLIDIIRDLNIFHFRGMGCKPVLLNVRPDLNFVYLPDDYIDYAMIGTVINGKKVPFRYNSDLAIPLTVICGEDKNEYNENIHDVQVYGKNCERFFAPEFTIDKKDRRIIFHGKVPHNMVYMEYVSTGISLNETTYVPVEWQTALRNYIDWQYEDLKEFSREKIFNIQNKERLYKGSIEIIRLFQQKMTISECLSEIRRNFRREHR